MPTLVLGRPLKFGDKDQIAFLKMQQWNGFILKHEKHKFVQCSECDGTGQVEQIVYECPHCHSENWNEEDVFREEHGEFICNNCEKKFKD